MVWHWTVGTKETPIIILSTGIQAMAVTCNSDMFQTNSQITCEMEKLYLDCDTKYILLTVPSNKISFHILSSFLVMSMCKRGLDKILLIFLLRNNLMSPLNTFMISRIIPTSFYFMQSTLSSIVNKLTKYPSASIFVHKFEIFVRR